MQENQPPQLPRLRPGLPRQGPGLPDRPAVVPILPIRVRTPGRQAPLPDAVAIRRLSVPDSAPPYDDEKLPARERAKPPSARDDRGPENRGEQDRGGGGPASDRRPPDGRSDQRPGAQPGGWPSQFAQVLAETLAGSRSAQQLTPWTTEQARRRIRQLGPALATDQRPKLVRVMACTPATDVLEMTAVVGFGPRIRVLALRLERDQPQCGGTDRWCCTAIESA